MKERQCHPIAPPHIPGVAIYRYGPSVPIRVGYLASVSRNATKATRPLLNNEDGILTRTLDRTQLHYQRMIQPRLTVMTPNSLTPERGPSLQTQNMHSELFISLVTIWISSFFGCPFVQGQPTPTTKVKQKRLPTQYLYTRGHFPYDRCPSAFPNAIVMCNTLPFANPPSFNTSKDIVTQTQYLRPSPR